MVSYTFALVLTEVSDDAGDAVPGPVNGILGPYSVALKARLSQYWDAVSGRRVQVDWKPDVLLQVTETMKQWAESRSDGTKSPKPALRRATRT